MRFLDCNTRETAVIDGEPLGVSGDANLYGARHGDNLLLRGRTSDPEKYHFASLWLLTP